jgi:hypothetical protein
VKIPGFKIHYNHMGKINEIKHLDPSGKSGKNYKNLDADLP